MIKQYILSAFIITLLGCAGIPKIVKVPCPARPVLVPVHVQGGTLDKENTSNIIENWLRTYVYIRSIEKLGCTR